MSKDYLQKTTMWRFEERGTWATHRGDYRGNWSPHIPRNLILKYTRVDDLVLDPFVGSGTTLIECKLLRRNGIGIDINQKAVDTSLSRLDFKGDDCFTQKIEKGNALKMNNIKDGTIDFICTHPPYANVIKYSDDIADDLSMFGPEQFLNKIDELAAEMYRVLKANGKCSVMIGDIRIKGSVYPLGSNLMFRFMRCGFKLKEIIIKEQFNCRGTEQWIRIAEQRGFYLLAHEYIYVFEKI